MTNSRQNHPAIFILSRHAEKTADKIKAVLGGEVFALAGRANGDHVIEDFGGALADVFATGRPIIGICAAGALIRLLAPKLQSKKLEPPVLCIAEDGSVVIPLLGGHRGANEMAEKLASHLGVEAALTTSGDLHFGIALDNPPVGYVLANPMDAKTFMASLLNGESIRLNGEASFLQESALPFASDGELAITVTTEPVKGDEKHLVYHPKTIVLGMGAERGADAAEAIELAIAALAKAGKSAASLAAIASIDLKVDEAALQAVADHFGVPFWTYSLTELQSVEDQLQTPSEVVKAEIGVAGVAEAASLFATDGALIQPKTKSKRTTAALAEAAETSAIRQGAERGRVFLVGTGPGTPAWRSPETVALLRQATDWVGYDLYLDLIQDLKTDQEEHRFPLGAEEKRVRHAMELAGEGKDVAVVCSGDPGIYAMATLAYELFDTGAAEGPISEAAKRVEVIVSPGISAFQAAAARAGAPIGHDFCCISLSDLLTPRADIIKRLNAAAEGDFVIAFYNPRSKRRVTLLDEAFDILRRYRPVDTPVILATDLGRPAENVRTVTLESVNSEDVDMLTLVMVGSSNSKAVKTGDGKTWVYTPRGYDRKET